MLTKESRTVLDYLITRFSSGAFMVASSCIIQDTGLPAHEVDSSLRYLASEGYFQLKHYKDGCSVGKFSHKAYHYKEFEDSHAKNTQTNIFNAPVTGSAIGNTGTITVNNGMSFQEARNFIQAQNISTEDKAEVEKIIMYIKTLEENDAPLKKGFLSKFGDVLAKHHWLPELVMKLLFSYFTGHPL